MSLLRLVLLLPAVLLASCAMHLPAPEPGVARIETQSIHVATSETVPVHLLADKLHTALVFELEWLEQCGFEKPPEIGNHKYVVMSWGDEVAYLQERWLSVGEVAGALFAPSPSVMECIPIDWKVEQVCHHQRVFVADVPRSAGYSLAAFLNACAAKNPAGGPLTIGKSSWGNGRLIRCPENYSYYFPRICNVWTAQALDSCGFSIAVPAALSANGLVRQATSRKNGFRKIWDGEKDPRHAELEAELKRRGM
ncbi:DUF2459 domain-containing protein [Luteolibacter marinus]|uniref:DUF2459 domain-containing protein n=1 Tax=Luteolibacter marinus TaxID=2776705 RepID=UPI0018683C39|nr:DUF2459 domain-containing protein [Luteolibacter marinus]